MKNNKGIRETMFGDTFAIKGTNKNKGFGFARTEHNILFKQIKPLYSKTYLGTMINNGFLRPLFFRAHSGTMINNGIFKPLFFQAPLGTMINNGILKPLFFQAHSEL